MSPCPAKLRAANGEPPLPPDPDRPSNEELTRVLLAARTIAVVGMSDAEGKAARSIPRILRKRGWTVIPVNPHRDTVADMPSYKSLADVPVPIDLVNVFRPSAEAADIARAAVAAGAKGLWLQAGIKSDEARAIAEAAGLDYVQNACSGAFARMQDLHPPIVEPAPSA